MINSARYNNHYRELDLINMTDRKGDPTKQPEDCTMRANGRCSHLRETSALNDMDGETYDCLVCGEHFRLYYDEMR